MTYRDQIEFKIRKLTRAIDAVVDLPVEINSTSRTRLIGQMRHKRRELRRAIADGRRSCG